MPTLEDLFGGSQGGIMPDQLSHGDATSLALVHALSQIQEAGTQRSASPIGSIAQSLAPLFAAPIQARQIEQKSAIENMLARAHMINALAQLTQGKVVDPEMAAAELANKRATTGKLFAETNKLNAEAASPYGKLPPGAQLIAADLQSRGIDPTPTNIRNQMQADKIDALRTSMETKIPFEVQMRQQLEDAKKVRDDAAPAGRKQGGEVFVDKATSQVVPNPTVGQVRDQGLLPISRNDKFALGEAKTFLMEANELEKLVNDLLPNENAAANTLSQMWNTQVGSRSKLAKLRAIGNKDVARFDTLNETNKLPLIGSLSRTGKMPVVDTKIFEKVGIGDADTVQSAMSRINEFRNMVYSWAGNMGLDPASLDVGVASHANDMERRLRDLTKQPQGRALPNGIKILETLPGK